MHRALASIAMAALAILIFGGDITPASAAPPNGIWGPVPGALWPAEGPAARRVAARPVAGGVMITITYNCGTATPCTTPEMFAVPFAALGPDGYVTPGIIPRPAPRERFAFVRHPAWPCVDPASRFAADTYIGVWTGGAVPDIQQCFGKLPLAPQGVRPDVSGLRQPLPPIHIPPMPGPPPPTPTPLPVPGRKPG
jgi:hypothetical protein